MTWKALFGAWLVAASATASAQAPKVTLDWVGLYELALCPPPKDEARFASGKAEAERRLPEFRAAWAKYGPPLLRETEAVVGRPFKFHETLATLHVCEAHPDGVSYPLAVNLSLFLNAYGGEYRGDPRADELFVNLVYHEILHRYIRDIVGAGKGEPMKATPLLLRHAQEHLFVRTHLHVIGIEKLVYRRLGKPEIPATMWGDNENPAYKRAYQLANDIGAEAIVADLRNVPSDLRSTNR